MDEFQIAALFEFSDELRLDSFFNHAAWTRSGVSAFSVMAFSEPNFLKMIGF